MHEFSKRPKTARPLVMFFCIAGLLLCGSATEPEQLSVYAPQARYILPITDLNGRQYVGLFELIEPVTVPEMKIEGNKWRLRIADPKIAAKPLDAEFQDGSSIAKIRGRKVVLTAPARSENKRLLLPLHGIGSVLMPLLNTDLIFHEASRRLFLGGTAELITPELRKGEPSTLVLHFPQSVGPSVSSEGNSIKFRFTRDPVISFNENEALNDKLFNSSNFAEADGAATLTVNGTAPLLAKFSDDGKTITISAAPAPPVVASTPVIAPAPSAPAAESQPAATATTPTISSTPARAAAQPTFLVMIDPAHGGDDTGARITPNLPEKDITLSLARKLRQELQARHIATTLLRDADNDLSLDQRCVLANLARPAVFISLHAEPGSALRIYTPALPSAADSALDRNGFLPWQSAQAAFSSDSSSLAATVADSLEKRELAAQVRPAFVQPMHSIAAPAIAVEAPADAKGLKISEDLLAGALAEAVAVRKMNAGSAQ